MGARISARCLFDYRAATGSVGLFYFVAILVPPFGGHEHVRLSIIGIVVSCVALYRPLGDRVKFYEDHIAYGNVFGWVSRSWPLDGTSQVTLDHDQTVSRWGLRVHGTLVLKGANGYAVALTHGRYSKEPKWSRFLLDQQALGKLHITDQARQQLTDNLLGASQGSHPVPTKWRGV